MHEDVTFWNWISPTTLGIVTETAVYHWIAYAPASAPNSPTSETPVKVFDRHASLAGNQIINYRVTLDEKWLVLVGISSNTTNPAGFKVKGAMQLYSKERGVSQPIEGHAASFAEIRLDGASADTKLFAFAVRTATGAKVSLYHRYYSRLIRSLTSRARYSCISSRSITTLLYQSTPRNQSTSSFHLRRRTISQSRCRFRNVTESSTSSPSTVSFICMIWRQELACT